MADKSKKKRGLSGKNSFYMQHPYVTFILAGGLMGIVGTIMAESALKIRGLN